eukprot:8619682-Pyramimonas_sp.AAC.1
MPRINQALKSVIEDDYWTAASPSKSALRLSPTRSQRMSPEQSALLLPSIRLSSPLTRIESNGVRRRRGGGSGGTRPGGGGDPHGVAAAADLP